MSFPWSPYKTWITGEILTAADLNNTMTGAANNATPANIDDYSATVLEMGTVADPYPGGSESQAITLAGELARIRYQILLLNRAIKGNASVSTWYDDPPTADVLQIGASSITANAPITSNSPLDMMSNKITGLAAATTNGDAVRYEQLTGLSYLPLSGGTLTDTLDVPNTKLQIGGFQSLPILQIVTGTSTTASSSTSATFAATNLSATITPKFNTSKVLVFAAGNLSSDTANAIAQATIFRAGANIASTHGLAVMQINVAFSSLPVSMIAYDSPATTSATTYAVALRSPSTNTVRFGATNTGTQYIILVEVAQ